MTDRTYIFDDSESRSELERLRAIEAVFDPATIRMLLAVGLARGWRCLEVGAGAGSIAQWMSGQVGPGGHVVAVDSNPRFLAGLKGGSLDVVEGDIQTAAVEAGSFDVAHARFVLIHVAEWEAALDVMIRSLKPGGWLVLEEPDFSSARSFAGRSELRLAFKSVHKAIEVMFARRGLDQAFGARIPGILLERGLLDVRIENAAPIVPGGSPFARMMGMSTRQLRDKYLATGAASERDLELYGVFTSDPDCWATYHATIGGAARKPGAA